MGARPRALAALWLLQALRLRASFPPGRYVLLHRETGQYLLHNATLGAHDAEATQWELGAAAEPGRFLLSPPKSGLYLSPSSLQPETAAAATLSGQPLAWSIFRVCQGSSVALVDPLHRVLAAVAGGPVEAAPRSGGGLGTAWLLLRPCAAEELGPEAWLECFPPGSEWHGKESHCCGVDKHGARGEPQCFDAHFTFERCCPQAHEQGALPPAPGGSAALPPRILCSGERIDGEERAIRLADLDGDRRWVKTWSVLQETRFDFAAEGEGPNTLQVVEGLPACGGPGLLEEAAQRLPSTELHSVEIFRTLHEAMLRLSRQSEAFMPDLAHSIFYLPFFPYLLMSLHRHTQDEKYLRCVSQTTAALGQLEAWRRNAGYDAVLALGYDRPWERRPVPGSTAPPDAEDLDTYDPRFANTLKLATHDVYFGDRHVLLGSNAGGGAYRNLRNIIVPLPFSLNCTAFRLALGRRRQQQRPPRFAASFVGGGNGATRTLLRAAAQKLSAELAPEESRRLALHFMSDDEGRRRLAQEPAELLRELLGGTLSSYGELLEESAFCLALPGDVSDLALRFLHAVSVGCVPVLVGGPSNTVPLPFAEAVRYKRFARFATVRGVEDAERLLRGLLAEPPPETDHSLEDVAGLFTHHADCSFSSGEPFLALLAGSLESRARLWDLVLWRN